MNKLTFTLFASLICTAYLAATPVLAHKDPKARAGDADKPAATAAAGAMSEGEVRKIDKEQGKITLKHGEIKNLDMPPMTMVFRVKDAAMLDQVKEGDKIRFTADKVGGQFTVTDIDSRK